jgi:Gpi18-like mannosyltransferase
MANRVTEVHHRTDNNLKKALIIALLSRIVIGVLIQHWYSSFTFNTNGILSINEIYAKEPFISEYTTKYTGLFVRWDSEWYIYIAEHGYPTSIPVSGNWAFSPLYPLLSDGLSKAVLSSRPISLLPFLSATNQMQSSIILSGIVITNLAFFASVYYLYKLTLKLFKSSQIALVSTVFYSFFFGGVYLSAFYPEALFMALAFSSFYYLEEEQFLIAGALGALASLARSDGFLIFTVFVVYALQKLNFKKANIKLLVKPIAASIAIISSFLVFNIIGLILVPSVPFPIQVVARNTHWVYPPLITQLDSSYFNGYTISLLCLKSPSLFIDNNYSLSYPTFISMGLLFIIVLPIAYFLIRIKRVFTIESKTLPYWSFYGLTALVLFTQSWALSAFRYSIPLIPMYWVSAKIYGKNKIAGLLLFAAMSIMLLLCICLFAIGDGLFS